MSSEKLYWLRKAPNNYRDLISCCDNLERLKELSTYDADFNQLILLCKQLKKINANKESDSFLNLKLRFISNFTNNFFADQLIGSGIRHSYDISCHSSNYDQVTQDALSSENLLEFENLDAVILFIDHHGFPIVESPGNLSQSLITVNNCISYLKKITGSIRNKSNAPILIHNIADPIESTFGNIDRRLVGTTSWLINEINAQIDALVDENRFLHLVDIYKISMDVGISNWHETTTWYSAKIPFSIKYLPLYSDHILRIINSIRGRSKKCLVLDLDNTLWGGVIGDDGIEGIQIGKDSPVGEAFQDLQKYILKLHNRGIILAVCSKNEMENALLPFKKHPSMILKNEHITVFEANWNDKATNIINIAKKLSIGLDSIVFLDDNPAERHQVRNKLPTVTVLELPDDPSYYSYCLSKSGYFESNQFLEEDKNRGLFYKENIDRNLLLAESGDLNSYYESLQMQAIFSSISSNNVSRCSQLINKSNQFNLTTIRTNEDSLIKINSMKDAIGLNVKLIDRFGDNGIISVLICQIINDSLYINTWVMSCRVLGRRVEESILNYLAEKASDLYLKKIIGKYIATEKNIIVKNLYQRLGFEKIMDSEKESLWSLDLDSYKKVDLPISVTHDI